MARDELRKGPEFARFIQEQIIRFIQTPPARGVNNFLLSPTGNVPTHFTDYVALFPPDGQIPGLVVTSIAEQQPTALDMYGRVLKLQITDDYMQSLHPQIRQDNEAQIALSVLKSTLNAQPIAVVSFGKTIADGREAAILSSVWGWSPRTALLAVQDRVKERQTQFN